jgi:hypothetical protein
MGKAHKPGLQPLIHSLITRLMYISGNRVKLSASQLRKQFILAPENTVLVVCYESKEDGLLELVGHAFATVWDYEGGMPTFEDEILLLIPVIRPHWLGHTACCQSPHSKKIHCNIPPLNIEVMFSLP